MTELPKIAEFPKVLAEQKEITSRMPGEVRKLESKIPYDLEIARKLDIDASDPVEGAINPEDVGSKDVMKPATLKRWVDGDEKHDMQVFGLKGESARSQVRIYGFGGATIDNDPGHPTYDPGFARRAAYVKRKAILSASTAVREYNFWADRADSHFPENYPELRHDMTVNWVAKHLVSLFEKQMEQQGDPNTLALFMSVEKSDLEIDGRVLKDLGFQAINKEGVDYDSPTKKGDDTIFCLTFDRFTDAMRALDEKMRTPPIGSDSRMGEGLTDSTVYYGEGKQELEPKLTIALVRQWLQELDKAKLLALKSGVGEKELPDILEMWATAKNSRIIPLIKARFSAGVEEYRDVKNIHQLGTLMSGSSVESAVHASGSTKTLVDPDEDTIQTMTRVLIQLPDGQKKVLEIASANVTPSVIPMRADSDEKIDNIASTEPSRELALLQWVESHDATVLGWVPFE